MKTNLSAVLILFCFAKISHSQIKPSVSIGKATTNTLTESKPAQFIATFPKDGSNKDSWLVDGYFSFDLHNEQKYYSLGLFGELHKNNLVSSIVDYREIGIKFNKDFLIFKERVNYDGKKEKSVHTRIITSSSLEYAHNKIKDTKEVLGIIGVTASLEQGKKLRFLQPNTLLINNQKTVGKFLNLSHNHSFDLGFIGGDDNVLLGDINFEMNVFPLSGLMDNYKQPEFFYLSWNIVERTVFAGNTTTDLDDLQTISAGIKYKINDKSSLGFAYYRYDGADPFDGEDNQTYETLSIKLRVVL